MGKIFQNFRVVKLRYLVQQSLLNICCKKQALLRIFFIIYVFFANNNYDLYTKRSGQPPHHEKLSKIEKLGGSELLTL